MKVVLNSDVAALGDRGDIVDVADGYARNYLFPRKLASKATSGAIEAAKKAVAARSAVAHKARETAENLATVL
ncbi:MAG: 50S ribosomal protein L9, partial [Acidimicrobiia bacterium]